MPWHRRNYPPGKAAGTDIWSDTQCNCEKNCEGKWWIEDMTVDIEVNIFIDVNNIRPPNTLQGVYGHEQRHVINFRDWWYETGLPSLQNRFTNDLAYQQFDSEASCQTRCDTWNYRILETVRVQGENLGHEGDDPPEHPRPGTPYEPKGPWPMPDPTPL
jgi:hypothetical protein